MSVEKVLIYGDSLLKATVPDAAMRYHFHLSEVMERYPTDGITVVNRAKMGATVEKGLRMVNRDLERGETADYALVAFGGNDSDYDWAAIAADPTGDHRPRTELPCFADVLRQTTSQLREAGIQPVLMTMPPIDPARYLDFICSRGLSRERIMAWLGEVQMIYRHQELYSDTVADVAVAEGLPLIPVRRVFLADHHMNDLISADGIHLTMPGYQRLFDTLYDCLQRHLS